MDSGDCIAFGERRSPPLSLSPGALNGLESSRRLARMARTAVADIIDER